MSADRGDQGTHWACVSIIGRRQGRPDQPSGPIVEDVCLQLFDKSTPNLGAARRRD